MRASLLSISGWSSYSLRLMLSFWKVSMLAIIEPPTQAATARLAGACTLLSCLANSW